MGAAGRQPAGGWAGGEGIGRAGGAELDRFPPAAEELRGRRPGLHPALGGVWKRHRAPTRRTYATGVISSTLSLALRLLGAALPRHLRSPRPPINWLSLMSAGGPYLLGRVLGVTLQRAGGMGAGAAFGTERYYTAYCWLFPNMLLSVCALNNKKIEY